MIARIGDGRLALAACLVLAACAPAAPSAVPTVVPTQAPATVAEASPIASRSTTGEPIATEAACSVLTAAEVGAALHRAAVEARPRAADGDFSYCNYVAVGGPRIAATALTRVHPSVFDYYQKDPDAIRVDGVGDAAVVAARILFVRKGDAVLSFQPDGAGGKFVDADIVAMAHALAAAIAARL
ncbi:MAG: hypothetical protein ACJ77N_07065 [Chloroflexota bacterium]